MSDRNAFINKVKTRQFAIAHSWRNGAVQESEPQRVGDSAEAKLFSQLQENLARADESHYINEYMPVELARHSDGKVKLFFKRVLHKLLKILFGWYFFPLIDQQNRFNVKLLNAVSLECQILASEQEQLCRLSEQASALPESVHTTSVQLAELSDRLGQTQDGLTAVIDRLDRADALEEATRTLISDDFYHDFEERFRGSREEIKERLQTYVPRVQACLPDWSQCTFVDIGSGRGEWLDILRENGAVHYVGVDLNERQNDICRGYGHTAVCRDCVAYLKDLPEQSVDMVSGFQIIEHLPMDVLCALFEECRRVLKKGGVILFETPNPRNVTVGADTFYLDPTHIRPLEPLLVQYLAKHYGFENAQIIEVNAAGYESLQSPVPDMDQLVAAMNDINRKLHGSQDYAIFAVKE